MNSLAIMENVRRYRTIASLYRQTAAFRPLHSGSLLAQAKEWEHRAVAELRPSVRRLPAIRRCTRRVAQRELTSGHSGKRTRHEFTQVAAA